MCASCLHGDLGFETYFLDFGEYLMQSLLNQYKELEEKPIHCSDAAFHKDFEKTGLTALIECG
jgi:hypothetical protein